MFDASSIEDYRAVKAPSALKARLDAESVTAKKAPRFGRIIAFAAAAAACLVLVAVGLFQTNAPTLQITAHPIPVLARSSDPTPRPCTAEIRLSLGGTITVESADAAILTADEKPLTYPHTAENELVLIWEIDEPEATLTVNGQSYTLRADLKSGAITVQ